MVNPDESGWEEPRLQAPEPVSTPLTRSHWDLRKALLSNYHRPHFSSQASGVPDTPNINLQMRLTISASPDDSHRLGAVRCEYRYLVHAGRQMAETQATGALNPSGTHHLALRIDNPHNRFAVASDSQRIG